MAGFKTMDIDFGGNPINEGPHIPTTGNTEGFKELDNTLDVKKGFEGVEEKGVGTFLAGAGLGGIAGYMLAKPDNSESEATSGKRNPKLGSSAPIKVQAPKVVGKVPAVKTSSDKKYKGFTVEEKQFAQRAGNLLDRAVETVNRFRKKSKLAKDSYNVLRESGQKPSEAIGTIVEEAKKTRPASPPAEPFNMGRAAKATGLVGAGYLGGRALTPSKEKETVVYRNENKGFKSVAEDISQKQNIPIENANAILAKKTRGASAVAKAKNPNLSKVKGFDLEEKCSTPRNKFRTGPEIKCSFTKNIKQKGVEIEEKGVIKDTIKKVREALKPIEEVKRVAFPKKPGAYDKPIPKKKLSDEHQTAQDVADSGIWDLTKLRNKGAD